MISNIAAIMKHNQKAEAGNTTDDSSATLTGDAPVVATTTTVIEATDPSAQSSMISDAVKNLLMNQIGHELFAHSQYTSIANWFACQGLEGFAAWARKQAADEVTHMNKIVEFLTDLDIVVSIPAVEATNTNDIKSVQDAVVAVMNREREVTAKWKAIGAQVMTDGCVGALELVQWFLKEQIEEENTVSTLIRRVMRAGEGVGVVFIDEELK